MKATLIKNPRVLVPAALGVTLVLVIAAVDAPARAGEPEVDDEPASAADVDQVALPGGIVLNGEYDPSMIHMLSMHFSIAF